MPDVQVQVVEPSESQRSLPTELLQGVQAIFCTVPPTNFDDLRSLRLIQIVSAGYTQLSGLNLSNRGIRTCNAAGVFDGAIAEWNIAMMVNLARDLRTMIRHQEAGIWDRSARFQREIRGATLGIWGYGGIGRQTARLAKAMGVRVTVMTREGIKPRQNTFCLPDAGDPEGKLPDAAFTTGQEQAFLEDLDFLTLAMPLTNANHGLIGEAHLRALPSHAFVLNPARGPLIQEQALLQALRQAWIAGAALDTHYAYPLPADHPLWQFPNVILTPHISGSTGMPAFRERTWDLLLENVKRLMNDEPLLNELSSQRLTEV